MRATPPACAARFLDLLPDARAALVGVDQHVRAAQRIDVVAGLADPHRLVVHEAMAAAHAVAAHAHASRYRPRRRPAGPPASAPAARTHSRGRPSASAWGSAWPAIASRTISGSRSAVFAPGLPARCTKRSPLASVVRSSCDQSTPALAAKPCSARVGWPSASSAMLRYGPSTSELCSGCSRRHARQQHRQPARRVQRLGAAAVEGDAALFQSGDDAVEERLREARQRLDRQFLGAEFDQQGFHFTHLENAW